LTRKWFLAVTAVAVALSGCLAYGGDPNRPGGITGYVYEDLSGETIPGAKVMIVGSDISIRTRADGSYDFPGLAPGTYSLMAVADGFLASPRQKVHLKPGKTLWVKFFLVRPSEMDDEDDTNDGE
jgi:hypothetical protein